MSTRTPPLQPSSRFHSFWGSFGNPVTGLPNQSLNVLPANVFAVLEPGDTAYAHDALWVCSNPGTLGGGDAVWRLVGPDHIDVIEGFSAGNYYEASVVGVGQGASQFSAVWYGFFSDFVDGLGQFLFGHSSGNFDGGWAISVGGRAGGSPVSVVEALAFETGPSFQAVNETVPQDANFYRASPIHVVLSYSTPGELALFIDGQRGTASPQPTAAAFLPGPGRLRIGHGGFFGSLDPAPEQACIGAGYIDGVALTAAQAKAHLQACRDADFRFVAAGLPFTNVYDVRTDGAAGAVLVDRAGSDNLVRVGAPAYRRRRV